MDIDNKVDWEQFLTPEILRNNLIIAGVYLVAFELLNDSIVDRIRSFYICGYDQDGIKIDPKYNDEVQSRSRSAVYASLNWLKESDVINDNDVNIYEKIKRKRNEIAHEIHRISYKGIKEDVALLFNQIVDLLSKIEKWWIIYVDIATDPDLYDKDIDADGVIPGPVMGLRILIDVALGSDDESKRYIDYLNKRGT
jgi:hypothetical protein